jgi:L-amino acid N-acyltransferase YncA
MEHRRMKIEEVPTASLIEFSSYFSGSQPEMVFASILAGNTSARMFIHTAQGSGPGILLWDKGNNVFYLSGDLRSDTAIKDLGDLIATDIRSASLGEGRAYFTVRLIDSTREVLLSRLFHEIELNPITKIFYRCRSDGECAPVVRIKDVGFVPIDRDLLEREDVANLEPVKSEIRQMWPSLARFFERGFGCAALLEDRVIGWCTAEYVSDTQCGIGIETVEACQNMGVATALTARFIELSRSRGLRPHWECNSRNLPSIRVAEKAGFEKLGEFPFYFGIFTN